jgi:diaminohydroxyphosphoribosylaminopyrimidine deaminase/5-amino-6-(5-phosphoribosylamino)uracil reductase
LAGARAKALQSYGVKLIGCADGPLGLDIASVLQELGTLGLTRVFCEGGGQLAASLVAANHADHVVTFHAGLALGAGGTPGIAALPDQPLADYPRLQLTRHERLGADLLSYWEAAI